MWISYNWKMKNKNGKWKYKYENICYHNIFLKKVLYKDKYDKQYIFQWMFVYYKGFMLTELVFLKELMLIKHVNRKSVMFFTTGIF